MVGIGWWVGLLSCGRGVGCVCLDLSTEKKSGKVPNCNSCIQVACWTISWALLLSSWNFAPQPGHIQFSCGCGCLMTAIVSEVPLAISALWHLAASWAQHFVTVVSNIRAFSWMGASTVSLSRRPSMIWSLMFFWVHSPDQKWQVLASFRKMTRKSSKPSPDCRVSPKFPSLHCLAFNVLLYGIYNFGDVTPLLFCEAKIVNDIVRVSCEKHRVGCSLSRPERLM